MRLKRTLIIVLCVIFVLSVFTACGSKQSSNVKSSAAKSSESDKITEIKLPIVKESITLTFWRPTDAKFTATMKDFGEIRAYQEIEKRTGIHINWMHPPIGQEKDQFNLMIASNDLPDIIYYDWKSVAGGPAKLIADGSIIKLNDLIDKYAPNLKKLLQENPDIKKQVELDDGTLYMFPFIREDPKMGSTAGPQLRKDWLDKLGLQIPKTIDDWHNVLVAFRDKDPNGNGKKDEIPFTGSGSNGQGILSLGNFAPAWGVLNGFYVNESGKIDYGPIQPSFRDFLTTMAQWYKEKLIDQDIATNDNKAFDYKITNNLAGSYFSNLIGNMGRYLTLVKPKNSGFDLVGVTWPVGPAGKPYTISGIKFYGGGVLNGAAISSKNKHVKETVELLDYCYSPEGRMLLNFGIEGESYKMENGYPRYTDEILKNPNGFPMDQALARYAPAIANAPMVQDKRYLEQMLIYPEQKEALSNWQSADPSLVVPPVLPTEEESQRIASIMNQVNTYQQEMMGKFIMGKEAINDATWNKYVNTIKGMGIDEAIKIQNAAMERYNNRK
ncbi:extracellular solute-binding protein [Caldanaerobius polysaccharolyticus]|uniref:extracellular solute-binding protein n=1 Tax=Caldanaerobius polysaccharolyticus TaxID=44256 RepID=UPI00047BE976|nr:extracellular solute-binding protein [Caldanaerobius polysaccharolyticus]